ncbi:helix-turn-helix domain-containing protein [Rhizobium sp. S96]|uniref:helix-turn-helix transcriptional regulator n=1 Tax=Rhizobium sp. S96 TaxID=3055140 RepID=UPI0025AB8E8D|nr:helix-turn-helix domain-containing protein [Rhizobium sp. S96]
MTKFQICRLLESMDSISEIMRTLRGGRALLGLSQEELAELAGVSRQIVVRLEKGGSNVLVEAVEKVRAALEAAGVAFIDATPEHGPGVAMARRPSATETDGQGSGDG